MKKQSAGLIMFRQRDGNLEVLLVHPGGPFWINKDVNAWSIPKGELNPGEDILTAARREFEEEIGFRTDPPFIPLGTIKKKSGKIVHAWAFRGNCDPHAISSNLVKIEWPPKSGNEIEIPEIDKAEFFPVPEAFKKINPAQVGLLRLWSIF